VIVADHALEAKATEALRDGREEVAECELVLA
jgi:hypothetical protein